jgi:hypothetical protein
MSKKERDWFRVLERVKKKEITLRQAAQIMVGSYRQCLRKYERYAQEGAKGLVHRGRGRRSNRNSYYQMARQSKQPPTTKKVKVRSYLNGELHFNYRGKDLVHAELPQRPVPAKAEAPTRSKPRHIPMPAPNHPWRGPTRAQLLRGELRKQEATK